MRASWMPAEATETALAPIAVSVRTRLATAKVDWNRRLSKAPERARLLRRAIGILELAEDLRLAEDHRVEPRGDGVRVAHCLRTPMRYRQSASARSPPDSATSQSASGGAPSPTQ